MDKKKDKSQWKWLNSSYFTLLPSSGEKEQNKTFVSQQLKNNRYERDQKLFLRKQVQVSKVESPKKCQKKKPSSLFSDVKSRRRWILTSVNAAVLIPAQENLQDLQAVRTEEKVLLLWLGWSVRNEDLRLFTQNAHSSHTSAHTPALRTTIRRKMLTRASWDAVGSSAMSSCQVTPSTQSECVWHS